MRSDKDSRTNMGSLGDAGRPSGEAVGPATGCVKRPYRRPTLRSLGRVSELTFSKSVKSNENPFLKTKNG